MTEEEGRGATRGEKKKKKKRKVSEKTKTMKKKTSTVMISPILGEEQQG